MSRSLTILFFQILFIRYATAPGTLVPKDPITNYDGHLWYVYTPENPIQPPTEGDEASFVTVTYSLDVSDSDKFTLCEASNSGKKTISKTFFASYIMFCNTSHILMADATFRHLNSYKVSVEYKDETLNTEAIQIIPIKAQLLDDATRKAYGKKIMKTPNLLLGSPYTIDLVQLSDVANAIHLIICDPTETDYACQEEEYVLDVGASISHKNMEIKLFGDKISVDSPNADLYGMTVGRVFHENDMNWISLSRPIGVDDMHEKSMCDDTHIEWDIKGNYISFDTWVYSTTQTIKSITCTKGQDACTVHDTQYFTSASPTSFVFNDQAPEDFVFFFMTNIEGATSDSLTENSFYKFNKTEICNVPKPPGTGTTKTKTTTTASTQAPVTTTDVPTEGPSPLVIVVLVVVILNLIVAATGIFLILKKGGGKNIKNHPI